MNDLLYFPHTTNKEGDFDGDGEEETCSGYWLASPCGLYEGHNVMRAWASDGVADHWYANFISGVRPIICLKADVELVKSDIDLGKDNAEYYELR